MKCSRTGSSLLFRVVTAMLALVTMGVVSASSWAQSEFASVSGRVTDPSGAIIAEADVVVTSNDTHISTSAKTNTDGVYVLPSLRPGTYTMKVSKLGLETVTVKDLVLDVHEVLSKDIVLPVGATSETVTVTSEAGQELIQSTSSELGTVIGQKSVQFLPLDGRNFSQLLTLTPGATPVSTSQSNSVGVNDLAMLGVPTASVAQPSIGGAFNRSNLYLLDGVINTELTSSAYVIPPIIDAIQEFKVQSHNDQAEYGSVLGGIVNVVSRGGTNDLHGAGWEFLRNNDFDARDPFRDEFTKGPAPFRQNQFGAVIGGPVWLPKLYDGRKHHTYFFFGYEGWRYSQASQTRYNVPTSAELNGDFSQSIANRTIYDPATTRPDPANPGQYIRDAFPGNIIPQDRIDPVMQSFLKDYFGTPNLTGDPDFNAIVTNPVINNSDHYMFRVDQQLGSKDNLFFRYDRLNVLNLTPITQTGDTGASVPALDYGGGWTHEFSSSLYSEVHIGRAQRPFSRFQTDSAGIGPMQKLGFAATGGTLVTLSSPWGSGGLQNANTIESPATSFSGGITWIKGTHQFKGGFQYIKQGNDTFSPPYGGYTFTDDTTGNPEAVGTTGQSLASALLGLPSQTNNTTSVSNSNRVSAWAAYFQDQWKVTRNVTLTYGLRFDHRRPFDPSSNTIVSGPNVDGHWWIGLNQLPPPCDQVEKSPCIPGDGTLASIPDGDKIQLSPYGRSWGPAPDWTDWGPRLGVAWKIQDKTVLRAGYGIVYDPLSGIEQDWKGIAGSWPATGSVFALTPLNQLGQPLTTVEQTFGQSGQLALPGPSPWTQTNWFFDPHIKDPRSQQWNVEIQRQMSANLALSVGYVGSYSDRISSTGLWNTALTPGPGTPAEVNARRPFPWYDATPFYSTSTGIANYNALQVKLEKRFSEGFQFLVSYTFSKAIDNGTSGFFGVENGPGGDAGLQNYYDPNGSRSVSSFDIPHFLSMSGVWDLPFGKGKPYLNHGFAGEVLGNWQLNSVIQLRSGQPYNLEVAGDVANIGNDNSFWNYARPNLIGNPTPAHQTSAEWYNPAAFAVPSFTYGNFGRNVLRSASVYDADVSLFKNFPIGEKFLISLRFEFFNVFNIQNYSTPDTLIGDPAAGRITSNVLPPRQIQFGLHLSF
jgi:Carboxypeptidase regulatory-like domain